LDARRGVVKYDRDEAAEAQQIYAICGSCCVGFIDIS
jgi:hypothetical protein